ncbi:hypothetical protein BJX63DRAFT_207231 [Aspergillus granulosus]|uniref:Uncharacterized protein n=1 Tax=Aspergillus granulosus TaxID=176169 RepID=A0ABR4HEU6_9EURO
MAILVNVTLAGLLLLLQGTQARNILAALSANIAKDTMEESLSIKTNLYSHGYNTTLDFDDVPTNAGTGTGTISTYSYLNISSFTCVDSLTAASLGSISIHDIDCASSQPNALFSASDRDGRKVRPRWVSDPTKLHAAGLSAFFNLNGLSIKPLGKVPRGLTLEVIAWEIRDSRPQNVYNTWIAYTKEGYQSMEHYDFTMFGTSWGRMVNMVEIYARVADQQGEWAFCLDDLDIEFLDRSLDE